MKPSVNYSALVNLFLQGVVYGSAPFILEPSPFVEILADAEYMHKEEMQAVP